MSKRNYYRFNQDPWNDEIYKPVKKENDMRDSRNLDRASDSDEETDAINRSYSYNNKEDKQKYHQGWDRIFGKGK